jgi:GxxExxY protein
MSERGWESGHAGVNEITERIIGSAIAVHRALGPGLLESTYRAALCLELDARGVGYRSEVVVPIVYRGVQVGAYRLDLVVEGCVIVEVKSVDYLHAVFEAQLLAYLRVTGERVGLLINFNERYLRDGVRRLINDLSVKRDTEAQRCTDEGPSARPRRAE